MFDGLVSFAMDRWRHDCGARIISRPGSPMSEGRFDLSTFRSERTNEASTLTITPKRSSSRDVVKDERYLNRRIPKPGSAVIVLCPKKFNNTLKDSMLQELDLLYVLMDNDAHPHRAASLNDSKRKREGDCASMKSDIGASVAWVPRIIDTAVDTPLGPHSELAKPVTTLVPN
ncbi:hypothetical protein TNCV_1091431 [Trichonephila clavipes]|nr:hypothetical protein TNCV_1091431 [Trichonephila clavipes]